MKRYYICPIVQVPAPGGNVGYAAKVPASVNHVAVFPVGTDGVPTRPWALVRAAGNDHSALLADTALRAFPDITMDSKVSVLTKAEQDKIAAYLAEKGISTVGITTQTTFRDVIRRVGTYLVATFNENSFDVSE